MRQLRTLAALCILSIAPLCAVAQSAQPAPPANLSLPPEPPNLGALKIKLLAYHDCTAPTCYTPTINRQSDLAIAILRRRVAQAKPGEKLAMVLDIDETSLSGWDFEKTDDFGYIVKDSDAFIAKAQLPAIAGTLRVFNEAISRGVSVFFITGRPEAQRPATAANLSFAGYKNWTGLALRGPHPKEEKVTAYKSGERRKILDAGYKIILNIGDQISDLNGPAQAERSIKLPDPFYLIP
jgi:predicted secreted acid phosphatase